MKRYPKYIELCGKKYEINTDFRVALDCEIISRRDDIGEYEKMMAIVFKLFGEKAIEDHRLIFAFFDLAIKYLKCGKDDEENNTCEKVPSMDFDQDQGYIKASFMSDYGIDLDKVEMHFWQFYDLLQGLTETSILNRVRSIREEPLSGKNGKSLENLKKAKEQVALKTKKTCTEKELDKLWESKMRKE